MPLVVASCIYHERREKLKAVDQKDKRQVEMNSGSGGTKLSVQKKEVVRTISNGGGTKLSVRTDKLVYWLVCICTWVYVILYIQSSHDALSFGRNRGGKSLFPLAEDGFLAIQEKRSLIWSAASTDSGLSLRRMDGKSAADAGSALHNGFLFQRKLPMMKIRSTGVKKTVPPEKNTTYGRVVGLFGFMEDQVLGNNLHMKPSCHEDGDFSRAVRSRKFVLIFHELSMTGAPLSMIELATELLSCGATVSVVALSRKGELMLELSKRGIELIKDKGRLSFEATSKADLIIAGSAVCASWIVLWTPVTTRIAALYSAADVYVINAQGLGETFGRVTVEVMPFGLPVLGTDAGGTKEIVEHNITGLLHPPGRRGVKVLARNLQHLLDNPSARVEMGMNGRRKAGRLYMKSQTYSRLARVISQCR